MALPAITRRQALFAGAGFGCTPLVGAQPRPSASGRPVVVAQVADVSAAQQDVSRDFLIGSRTAWQDVNARGGLRGRPVQHQAMEIDGTAGVTAALAALQDPASCVVLSGTVGDRAAGALVSALRHQRVALAHAAPWLQNSSVEVDEHTFPVFAARQEQIAHALKSLSVMSVQEIGVVYASDVEHGAYQEDLSRTAAALKLQLQSFRANGDLLKLGQRFGPATPALLLFVGGTPELAQFTQGLEKQSRRRYIVALADVNLQTLMQMGAARTTPVIATQAVPLVNANAPVVRAYRDALSRRFDEPPSPLGLAGFIAARYTFEVLNDITGPITRQSALAAFQRRSAVELGGFRIAYDSRGRAGTYVTQSMLTQDGRVIG